MAVTLLLVQASRVCRVCEGAHRSDSQALVVTPKRSKSGNVKAALQTRAGGAAAIGAVAPVPRQHHGGGLEVPAAGSSGLRIVPRDSRQAAAVRGRGQSLGELQGGPRRDARAGSAQSCHLLPSRQRTSAPPGREGPARHRCRRRASGSPQAGLGPGSAPPPALREPRGAPARGRPRCSRRPGPARPGALPRRPALNVAERDRTRAGACSGAIAAAARASRPSGTAGSPRPRPWGAPPQQQERA